MSKALEAKKVTVAEGAVIDPEGPPPTSFRGEHIVPLANGTKQFIQPFLDARIDAGQTINLASRSTEIFHPERLAIPAEYAANVQILDIRIGMNSQLHIVGAIDGSLFSMNNEMGIALKMDWVRPQIDVVLVVRNKRAFTVQFNAVLIGPLLQ